MSSPKSPSRRAPRRPSSPRLLPSCGRAMRCWASSRSMTPRGGPAKRSVARPSMPSGKSPTTRGTDIVILSDEVYEHILFDGEPHASLCGHPELAARSLVRSSFGKTYHITGWKIGYIVGPAALMAEFRKVHQFNVFTVHAPSQLALADYMQDAGRHRALAAFYEEKRDFFRALMATTPFDLLPCRGTYFQLARYDRI